MGAIPTREMPVLDSTLAWREAGTGRPVLLLHGNPTSSYLWRHVLATVATDADADGRWIALDLIGMGASGKPSTSLRLVDHIRFVDAFIDTMALDDLVLVGHDWGVAIALDLLRRRGDRIRGIAVMEGHIRPLAGWAAFDEGGRQLFQDLRSPGRGERMVLEENFFLEHLLPAALQPPVAERTLRTYRAPYPRASDRAPLLQWAREIPIGGEPEDVTALMSHNADQWASADLPKLLLHGEPGVLVNDEVLAWARAQVRNLSIRSVGGPAGHFLPEDRPTQVAQTLVHWVNSLGESPPSAS